MSNKVEIDLDRLTQEIDCLKNFKAKLSHDLSEIKEELEQKESQLVVLLTQEGKESMNYKNYTFGFVERSRTAFDQALFKQEQPKMFEKYYITKTKKDFKFKIN